MLLVQYDVCEVGNVLHECGVYEYVLLRRVFPRSSTLRVVAACWLRLLAWGVWPTWLVVMYVYGMRRSGICLQCVLAVNFGEQGTFRVVAAC